MRDDADTHAHDARSTRQRGRRRLFRRTLRIGATLLVLGVSGLLTLSCAVRPPALGSVDGVDRLDLLERSWPGLSGAVRIEWDRHLIPSIEAGSDEDAAYAIGLVHAHLRGAQMELFRKVSQGRISEMAGPFVANIDEAIRALDLDRAVTRIEADLPPRTAAWLGRYVQGINDYRERLGARPADARTLGLTYDEAWTIRDVLTFGRLASVDVNWGRWFTLAALRDQRGYDDFVGRLWAFRDAGLPSFGAEMRHDLSLLTDIGRTGSNAFVVSGDRSASGGALVGSDPHLGLPQPNIWCVIGYRTPEQNVVGLTIPGLPFVLVGRNERIAWSGTNMQSASSALYSLPEDWRPVGRREERIEVRFWFDRSATLRESEHGPVLTDAKLLRRLGEGDVAFRWRGHEPSDEASAFLRAARAESWEQFRAAFTTYAVGGQNMLYADAEGGIGQIMALEAIPAAAAASRLGAVDPNDERFAWSRGVPSDRLPASFNPEAGFLASANNVPTPFDSALVPQGNTNDRMSRMNALLSEDQTYTLDDLARIQQDTYSGASRRVAQRLVEIAGQVEGDPAHGPLLDALAAWNGRYDADSQGAAAYQCALSELIDALYADRYAKRIRRTLRSGPYVHDFVLEDLESADSVPRVERALRRAARRYRDALTWGEVHRLRLAHPIGFAPFIGASYVFRDVPHAGSTTTIYKGAHAVSGERHATTFGANARVLFDMGRLDDNRVALLGGQDGWIGSDRLLDQVDLWREGAYIDLPMTADAQRARSVRSMRLEPEASETHAASQTATAPVAE